MRRANGRFEIRESVHTPKGPRARTLATFRRLTEEALAHAASRSQRPFDARSVVAAARRAGAPVARGAAAAPVGSAYRRFVDSSRRMARSLEHAGSGKSVDPGLALIELLGFAEQVRRSQPRRRSEPLRFPPLGSVVLPSPGR